MEMGEGMGGLTWMQMGAGEDTHNPYFCGTRCAQTLAADTNSDPSQSTAMVQLKGNTDPLPT